MMMMMTMTMMMMMMVMVMTMTMIYNPTVIPPCRQIVCLFVFLNSFIYFWQTISSQHV